MRTPMTVPCLGEVELHLSKLLPCKQEFQQVRFPKSKRRRIRKKWARNQHRNWRSVEVEPVMMQIGGRFYVNKLMWQKLKKETSNASSAA